MKLAVVGTGMIVRDFLPVASDVPGMVLRAIVGRASSRETVEELRERHGIERAYLDLDECLADPEVDTVWVALPNALHAQTARRALLAGKHVICEKPFVLHLDELDELQALATERDLVLVEAITNQYLANYRAIAERLPELGRLRLVQSVYSQYSSRYDAFRAGQVLPSFDPAVGGGALWDLGIYPLHLVVGLLGRPRSVRYTANVERGVDTSGVVVLEYDGCTAVCVCAKDSAGHSLTTIQGEDGTIVMDGAPNICGGFDVRLRGGPAERVDRTVHEHRMVEEFRAFERMIRERDVAERDRRLDHSRLVLEVAIEARASL
ncbi:Gfo/Idh/MocA family oxidoreductase [Actinotalea sp. M2MS4P-6]|uniref:Gfo/Idh/MocA family protein n=1 Tax=Actinotalea sp. M2MS4P-6 TaxID=2983762 RepID=UPI0021E47055|nr:Gfo/Idh/MocA family oxidoreductase [Actinotalea sp. M2MS4P-6]MCV2394294.1 Gfo/Idh/MocA family oxidoreductase [Actinotalea sp. M2MS4P-6]